jgi:hypothetical protein
MKTGCRSIAKMFLMVLSFVIAPAALASLVSGQAEAANNLSIGAFASVSYQVIGASVGVQNAQVTVFDGKTGTQLAQGMTDVNGYYTPYVNPQCGSIINGIDPNQCGDYSLHLHLVPPAGTQLAPGYAADQTYSGSIWPGDWFYWKLTKVTTPPPPPPPACTLSGKVLFPGGTCCSGSYHIKQNGGPFGGSEEICN